MIADWIREKHDAGESYSKIAGRLGVSKAHVQYVVGGTRGAGAEIERTFARLFYDGSVDAPRKAAAAAAAARKVATREPGITPNLKAAIGALSTHLDVPNDVIERARRVAEMGEDLLFETWVALLSDWIRHRLDESPRRA